MERRRWIMVAVPLALVLSAAAFGYSLVGERAPPAPRKPTASRRTLANACGSAETYRHLKTRLFDEASEVRGAKRGELDLLAGTSVVRVEDPLTKAIDESLGVTVCTGEFTLELPPGAERSFGGQRRLRAKVEYAAQRAADGSGIVYQLRGAEPIVYRLAAVGVTGDPLEIVEQAEMPPAPEEVAMPAAPVFEPAVQTVAEPVEEMQPVKATIPSQSAAALKKLSPVKPPETPRKRAEKKAGPTLKSRQARLAPKKPETKIAGKAKAAKIAVARTDAKRRENMKKAEAARKVAEKKQAEARKKAAGAAKKVQLTKAKSVKPKITAKVASKPKIAAKAPGKKVAVLRAAAGQGKIAAAPCRSANRSAQLLCANPSLAAKERRVTSLYYSALENADTRTQNLLRRTAGHFRAYFAGCTSEACISQAFDGRTREIRDIMADMR